MDIEALERLGRLRQAGALGEDEFEAEKQRILGDARKNPAETITPVSYPPASSLEDRSGVERPRRQSLWFTISLIFALVVIAILGVAAARYFGLLQISHITQRNSGSGRYMVHSQVKHIHIGLTSNLPHNPHVNDASCAVFEKPAIGQAAKLVTSAGWHLTSEATAGKFSAVAFVGACSPISATFFESIDANVGLFDGDKLTAVIYGKGIGSVETGTDPAHLRIKSSTKDKVIGIVIVGQSSITVDKQIEGI